MGLLGAHMSIAGGLEKAIERGDEMGCESIQIFTQSSRTWKTNPLTETEINAFKSAFKKAKTVKRVVAHNSYLLNLSTETHEVRKKSVDFFITMMERCEALGIESLITHPGSHLGAGEATGLKKTSQSLNEVLKACSGFKTQILIENTAGQGDCVGHSFEHLKEIVEGTQHPEKIFFCFDTQHAFAAGYDLRQESGYKKTFQEFDRLLSLKKLKAFHLNDALKEMGCRVDRHANLGTGHLGMTVFKCLVNDSRFKSHPMCLETDPGEEMENYRTELAQLRLLISD
ncbi:MAG: deoxyribonuclease IV [Deltaproteobacteria bacterium]